MREQNRERLISHVSALLSECGAPGAAIAIIRDGRTALTAAVGYRDLARTQPLEGDARFYIYSVTKTLIATIVLRLAERGVLALDDDARTWLPRLPVASVVTIRDLLRHTAHLPDYGGMPEYARDLRADPGRPWSDGEFLSRTLGDSWSATNGSGWTYSNIGYLILKLVIERAAGGSLREVVDAEIARPLGLEQTFVAETLADARVLAPGYSRYLSPEDPLKDVSRIYHPGWVSHGVGVSTAAELARALDAIISGRLLTSAMVAEMMTPTLVPGSHPFFRQAAYGLGVMIDTESPHGYAAGHGGGGPGYSIGAFSFENAGGARATTVALVNCDEGDVGKRIAFALADGIAGNERGTPESPG
jgi:D-alanyl-D-alanine carboxypeptidase